MIYAILREAKILRYNNEPKQRYCDNGCFRLVAVDISEKVGYAKITNTTQMSVKGMDLIRSVLDDIIESK